MNLEVLCYLGLLRFPEQLEPSLALLPAEQKAKAASFLAAVKDLPRPELLRRWSKLREDEAVVIRRKFEQRMGTTLDEVSPFVHRQCLEWLMEQDGRQDP